MSMPRKTIEVSRIKELANNMLLHTGDEWEEGRRFVQTFTEVILMETRNYKGFQSLTEEELETSERGKSLVGSDSRVRYL